MERASFLLAAACAVALPITLHAQRSRALFQGAELLDSCVVDLPLTYAKKDKERYTQAAHFLEDQELIYAVRNKKTGMVNYSRVYVVVETAKDGDGYVYVESADQHVKMDGLKEAYFPQFKPANERFYAAECFDRMLAAHPELKAHLVEARPEAPGKASQ